MDKILQNISSKGSKKFELHGINKLYSKYLVFEIFCMAEYRPRASYLMKRMCKRLKTLFEKNEQLFKDFAHNPFKESECATTEEEREFLLHVLSKNQYCSYNANLIYSGSRQGWD